MDIVAEKSLLGKQIAEKRRALRDIYGGMMSPTDLDRELGFKTRGHGESWAASVGIEYVPVSAARRGYETDRVAEEIVKRRVPV